MTCGIWAIDLRRLRDPRHVGLHQNDRGDHLLPPLAPCPEPSGVAYRCSAAGLADPSGPRRPGSRAAGCRAAARSAGAELGERSVRRPRTAGPAGPPARPRWPGRRPARDGGAGRCAEELRQGGQLAVGHLVLGEQQRASSTVSTTGEPASAARVPAHAAVRKPTSNGALCAVSTQPRAKARKPGSTAAGRRRAATMASLMPVSAAMSAGIAPPGLTRAANSPRIRPPLHPDRADLGDPRPSGDQPVVSTSTTTKSRL